MTTTQDITTNGSNQSSFEIRCSNASVAFKCLGSNILSRSKRMLTVKDDTVFSTEGTEAHAIAACFIESALSNSTNSLCYDLPHNEEMLVNAARYLQFIDSLNKKLVFEKWFVEKLVSFSIPNVTTDKFLGGTADFIAIYKNDDNTHGICIVDYKYGQFVDVVVKDNYQLLSYLIASIHTFSNYKITTAEIHIFQPRVFNIEDEVKSLIFDYLELENILTEFKRVIGKYFKFTRGKEFQDIKKLESSFNPGSHCTFCNARVICKSFNNYSKITELDIEAIKNANTDKVSLTYEEIAEYLQKLPIIKSFLNKLEPYALSKAINDGVKFPGFKLVEGRGVRKWIENQELIVTELKELGVSDPFEHKLKSFTTIEKQIGKNKINALLHKPPGKPRLVSMDSSEPELIVDANTKLFTEFTDEFEDF